MYKVGETTNDGHVIASVAAQDDDLLVYITREGQIRYNTVSNAFPPGLNTGEVASRMVVLKRCLDKCEDPLLKGRLNDRLAGALYDALKSSSTKDALERLRGIGNELGRLIEPKNAKLRTVGMLFVLTLLVCALLLALDGSLEDGHKYSGFPRAGALGALGAFFSVLTRNSELAVESLFDTWNTFLECAAKAMTGCIAGVLALLAVKANVVLGFVSGSEHTLLLLSVVAGFSERLVPDLLKSTAKKAG
jgi:hypothetical protein